jgi:hypothetical protein
MAETTPTTPKPTMNESYDKETGSGNLVKIGDSDLIPSPLVPRPRYSRNTNGTIMPTAVYSLVWNFILDSDGINMSKAGYSVDLKTISSFMVVCKTAKEEFHACHGWNQCALALKREATFKRQVIAEYEEEGSMLAKTGNILAPLTPDELKACRSFVAKADDMRKVDARLVRIQTVLLRKACHHAATMYTGDVVSSWFSYTSTLERSIQVVERDIKVQPFLVELLLAAIILPAIQVHVEEA